MITIFKRPTASIVFAVTMATLGFQNCSPFTHFNSSQDLSQNRKVICNPLTPSDDSCAPIDGQRPGLAGHLYFLTPEAHGSKFNNNLFDARLNDYKNFGFKAPAMVVMTQINVPPQNWQKGFAIDSQDSSLVTDYQGKPIKEWFAIFLKGFIHLPKGNYQFSTISDDGIKVEINGKTLINNDSIHAPEIDCASIPISFDGTDDSKPIQVSYYQGPRQHLALQLFVRPTSEDNSHCKNDGSWQEIPPSSFFH